MQRTIRPIIPDDNFQIIADLMDQTWNRFMAEQGITRSRHANRAESVRELFFPPPDSPEGMLDHKMRGFVAEQASEIVALMGVSLAPSSAGYLVYGFREGHEEELEPLLDRCIALVREYGGKKCVRFTSLLPGRIRNPEITFWERLGFVSDDYFSTLIKIEMDEWNPPANLDLSRVTAHESLDVEIVARILEEDRDEQLAEEFRREYSPQTPDTVLLTLTHDSGQTAGLAFYKVKHFQDRSAEGKVYDGLGAWGVGVHFRPQIELSRREKRAFIQAVLASMQQLGVIFASARISSRDFDAFIEMLAEGFYFQGRPTVVTRLTRRV